MADATHRDDFDVLVDELLAIGDAAERRDRLARLSAEERSLFEQHERIDARLKDLFEIPEAPASLPRLRRSSWVLYASAAAASIAMALGIHFLVQPPPAPYRGMGVYERFRTAANEQFEPDWVCETDEQFAEALDEHFDAAFVLERVPELEIVGWNSSGGYGGAENARPIDLLLRVDGEPVVVVIARKRHNPKPDQNSDGELQTFRKRFGPLYLYEVTPLGESRVLDLVRRP